MRRSPSAGSPGNGAGPPSRAGEGGCGPDGGCSSCAARSLPRGRALRGRQSGASGRWTPPRSPFGGLHLSPCRRFAHPVPPSPHPPTAPNLPKQRGRLPPARITRLRPRRWQRWGNRGNHDPKRRHLPPHQPPQSWGDRAGGQSGDSRPGWQGWICSRRREEKGQGRINISLALQKHQREIMVCERI